MKTVADLGRAYKKRHAPKFDHISDEEMGRDVKRRNPDSAFYREFKDTGITIQESQQLQTTSPLELIDFQLENKIQSLIKSHNPEMGIVVSLTRKWKLKSQNQLLDAAGEQQDKLISQAVKLAQEIIEGKKREIEFRTFLAQNQNIVAQLEVNGRLINEAAKLGMFAETFSDWNRFELEFRLRMESNKAAHDQQMEREARLAEIRAKEHADKVKADLDAKIRESQHIIGETEKQNLKEQGLINRLKKELQDAICERVDIKNKNHPAELEEELLEIQNTHIDSLKKQLNERYSRLV